MLVFPVSPPNILHEPRSLSMVWRRSCPSVLDTNAFLYRPQWKYIPWEWKSYRPWYSGWPHQNIRLPAIWCLRWSSSEQGEALQVLLVSITATVGWSRTYHSKDILTFQLQKRSRAQEVIVESDYELATKCIFTKGCDLHHGEPKVQI